MKKLIIIILFLITSASLKTYSLDTTSCHYFPLHVGNTYYYYVSGNITSYYSECKILNTQVINGKLYFYIINTPYFNQNIYMRYDSTNGYLMVYQPTSTCGDEKILCKLSAILNETTSSNCYFEEDYKYVSEKDITLFGIPTHQKEFIYGVNWTTGGFAYKKLLMKDFGPVFQLYSYYITHVGGYIKYELIGAKIKGVNYGDTSHTAIMELSNKLPEKFSLSQNYPNPFNPTTNIKYQIKNNIFVTLKVYDILGKEVAVLVNEKQSPGTYEVQFPNGESANVQLPSGVYFYTLYADGERIDTKKMVLLK
jgi:hypothetical protein